MLCGHDEEQGAMWSWVLHPREIGTLPGSTPAHNQWNGRDGFAMLPGIHRILARGKGQAEG